VLAACVASACAEPKPVPRGLRVPLPDGWVATASGGGELAAGPKGRVVMTLERRPGPLPTLEVLTSAVEAEGGDVVRGSGATDAISVRYQKGALGFLAVRTLEGGLLLCASTPMLEPAELEAAEALCGSVRLEARPGT